jgi:PAS domain S-box-containing protein
VFNLNKLCIKSKLVGFFTKIMISKIKILHLEDSLGDSDLMRAAITAAGIEFDYFLADNEADFLHTLQNEDINIIISDYSLPLYSGKQALKLASEKYAHIPFIFVSGAMGEDTAITAMLSGATDCVLKRKLEKLGSAINRALKIVELNILKIQTEEVLSDSEVRYRRIFESANDGILILDSSLGKIVDVNPYLIALLGYSKDSFMEKEIWEIEFLKDFVGNYDKFLELQQKASVSYNHLSLKKADGQKVDVEYVSSAYLANRMNMIQFNIRNITERKLVFVSE